MPRRPAVLVLLALAASGCPTPPGPSPDDDVDSGIAGPPLWGDAALVLGVTNPGDGSFLAMPAEPELQRGFQGGFHLPVRYRVEGHAEPMATFELRVRRASDRKLLSRGQRDFEVAATDGGAWASDEVVVFLCPPVAGVTIAGETLELEVLATSPARAFLAGAAARVVPRCGDGDPAYCESTCRE